MRGGAGEIDAGIEIASPPPFSTVARGTRTRDFTRRQQLVN